MDFQKTYGSMDPKDHAEWHTFNDAEFFIAPNNTPAFKTAAMKQFGLNDIQSGMEGKSAYEVMKIECAIKAETILLDWKGVTNEGDEVKYTKEKARRIDLIKILRLILNIFLTLLKLKIFFVLNSNFVILLRA